MFGLGTALGLILPLATLLCVFTFIGVAVWSDNRRKERESYYKHETYRKLMEQQGGSAEAVLELMREEESQRVRQRVEGLRLGGLITFVAGVGLAIFLFFMLSDEPVYLIGLVPILIGIVLAFYGFFMAADKR